MSVAVVVYMLLGQVVLGFSALITPLVVSQQLVRIGVPLVIGASVLLLIMSFDGHIGLFDGLLLTGGIVACIVFSIQQGRKESATVQAEYAQELGAGASPLLGRLPVQIGLIVGGLVLPLTAATLVVLLIRQRAMMRVTP